MKEANNKSETNQKDSRDETLASNLLDLLKIYFAVAGVFFVLANWFF